MNDESPEVWNRRLNRAWSLLSGLTVASVAASLWAARGGHALEAGLGAAVVVLALAFFKARLVLDHFLDLRRAGAGWRATFNALLVAVLAGLLLCYAVPVLLVIIPR